MKSILDVAVPATGFCYVVGYVASARTYVQAGAPITSIDATTFLAAGALCASLSGIAILCVWLVELNVKTPLWAKVTTVVAFQTMVFTAVSAAAAQYTSLCTAFTLVIAFLVRRLGLFKQSLIHLPSVSAPPANDRATRLYISWIVIATWYAGFFVRFYPNIPVYLGGGQPYLIARFGLTDAERPGWQNALCETALSRAHRAGCRGVHRVLETDKYIYLDVRDSRLSCERAPVFYGADDRCIMRMPVDQVDVVVFPLFLEEYDQHSFIKSMVGFLSPGWALMPGNMDAGAPKNAGSGEALSRLASPNTDAGQQ